MSRACTKLIIKRMAARRRIAAAFSVSSFRIMRDRSTASDIREGENALMFPVSAVEKMESAEVRIRMSSELRFPCQPSRIWDRISLSSCSCFEIIRSWRSGMEPPHAAAACLSLAAWRRFSLA